MYLRRLYNYLVTCSRIKSIPNGKVNIKIEYFGPNKSR
jgi:hypothetical protein